MRTVIRFPWAVALIIAWWDGPSMVAMSATGVVPHGGTSQGAAQPPQVLGPCNASSVTAMPDGTTAIFILGRGAPLHIDVRQSHDGGRTWSEPTKLHDLPAGHWSGPQVLVTRDGSRHFFLARLRGEGSRPAVDRFIDLWHLANDPHGDSWTSPVRIFEGYCGALMGAVELSSGRIVVPFAQWIAGRASAPPAGSNETMCVYSDDGGKTWQQSPSRLTAPCHVNFNGNNYGAIEPVALPLADGRVWMLMRTQTGFLYESFSRDGAAWSVAAPSQFVCSTSPASLVRLPDRRMVLFWNHCAMPPRVDGQGVYGGRDALHAAISSDEGASWRGFREVYRDPLRNESPPRSGDRGTAYPVAAATSEGRVVLLTGQGENRRQLILVDPDWLLADGDEDDLSRGLEDWHVFTSFGPATRFWRDRTQGARLIDDPKRPGARVLHVRRADERPSDGAIWNFPAGPRGSLTVRVLLRPGSQGASIGLADRYFDPTDDEGDRRSVFQVALDAAGRLNGAAQLHYGRWHDIELAWNVPHAQCKVRLDGQEVGNVPARISPGNSISYLRLRSTAATVDNAGLLIARVATKLR